MFRAGNNGKRDRGGLCPPRAFQLEGETDNKQINCQRNPVGINYDKRPKRNKTGC